MTCDSLLVGRGNVSLHFWEENPAFELLLATGDLKICLLCFEGCDGALMLQSFCLGLYFFFLKDSRRHEVLIGLERKKKGNTATDLKRKKKRRKIGLL